MLVVDVAPHSPAYDSGLRKGDLVVELGNIAIEDIHDLHRLLNEDFVGKLAPIRVLRRGNSLTRQIIPQEYHEKQWKTDSAEKNFLKPPH